MKILKTLTTFCLQSSLLAVGPVANAQDDATLVAMLGAREQLVAAFDGMPQARLEELFLRCSKESSQSLLPLADAVPCAMAWDTLLRREFRGDIGALLAWWRAHRDN